MTRCTMAALAALCLAAAPGCRDDGAGSKGGTPAVVVTKTGVEMVRVPAGWFEMGSAGGPANERPVHRVWVDAFLMDRTEVTQGQFHRLQMPDPSHFKDPKRPVEQTTLLDAIEYCNERSYAEGLRPCYVRDEATNTWRCDFDADGYRLPTEAEWEYACRAGTTGRRHFAPDNDATLKRYAWGAANSGKQTHLVGSRKPNGWGLCDMYGNVAEWCHDRYAADYYTRSDERNPRGPAEGKLVVLRGGAWDSPPERCRSAWRAGENPRFHDICFAKDTIGFRCVRRAPASDTAVSAVAEERTGETPVSRTADAPIASAPATRPARPATGFVYADIYLKHDTGSAHPESAKRLTAIVDRLKARGVLKSLVTIRPRDAEPKWLTTVHTAEYVRRFRKSCEEGVAYLDSRDTPISARSYDVAVAAAGGVLAAVDAVARGKVRNAFCAVRPPGHHALKGRAMGFCLFNNVAVAARYAQKARGLAKVLIVDWDVHHGNGTQATFYDDPTVMYFSAHRYPFYPGTGAADETGAGKGKGLNVNVPLPAGAGDAAFVKAFKDKLVPAAAAFKPDLVLISAGFDAHADDPLGGMKMTPAGYAELTRIVKAVAARHAKGRLVSVLEGGYDLPGLAKSVEAHIAVLKQ